MELATFGVELKTFRAVEVVGRRIEAEGRSAAESRSFNPPDNHQNERNVLSSTTNVASSTRQTSEVPKGGRQRRGDLRRSVFFARAASFRKREPSPESWMALSDSMTEDGWPVVEARLVPYCFGYRKGPEGTV